MTLHKIVQKGDGHRKEGRAGGTVTPGHMVALNSSEEWVVHASAGGSANLVVAEEKELFGGIVSTTYANDEQIHLYYPQRGDELNMLLKAGESVSIGDKLESQGDGTLRKVVSDTSAGTIKVQSIVATSLEAINANGGVDVRIRVEAW
jgi:hypothetical protein